MEFRVTKHIEKLAQKSQGIKNQFYPSKYEERTALGKEDPFMEDSKYRKSKGLIHKYPRRALLCLTSQCAAYCRFCTRRRHANMDEFDMNEIDIDQALRAVKANEKINEIIFSGGDPFMKPALLDYAISKFSKLKQIKIIRIHTRLPVSDPGRIDKSISDTLNKIQGQSLYIVVHFEHPHEINPETVQAIGELKKSGAMVLAQSVFLKGINDNYEILYQLFNGLTEIGVKPYMIGHCDLVRGAEHFIVPIEKEIKIMTQLRKTLSGIAFPKHVIDVPGGCGKVTVPQNFWKFDTKEFTDFNNKKIKMY